MTTSTAALIEKSIARNERKLDAAQEAGDEKSATIISEILAMLYELQAEDHEARERAESEAPRRAAEARLAHHMERDTLDLY